MLNFALVGCGGMASQHARNLRKLAAEVRVTALCDNVSQCANAFNKNYFPEAAVFHDYEQMIQALAGQLDAVVLVTPHAQHFPHAQAALEAGLNVLVEKPMVTGTREAWTLRETVRRTGKLLGIAFQAPYSREFRLLARQRDEGQWGQVRSISGNCSQNWVEITQNTWRQDPAQSGGGFAYDTGAHLFNAMLWLMNEPVESVAAFVDNESLPVDVNTSAILRFQSGVQATASLCGDCPQFDSAIEIRTDRMIIDTTHYGQKLEEHGLNQRNLYPPVPPMADGADTPHANFVNALLGREPLLCGVEDGVRLCHLMDAVYESGKTGRMIPVQPAE